MPCRSLLGVRKWPSANEHGTSLCIPLHLSTSLCISLHPSASLYIPLHLSTSLCISLHPSASPSPSPSSSVGQLSHRAGSLPSCTLPETREAPAIITDAHDEVGTVPTGLPHPCQWCPIKSGDPGDRIMICVGDPSRFHVKGTVSTVGGGFFSIFFFSPFLSFPFFLSLGSVCPRVNSCEKWNLCGNGFFTWCVEDGVAWR
jgi:hypothetical protein